MPTYHACGVTIRLSTCELKPTLSNFVDLRMGGEQRKDAVRIQKSLSGGERLGERPIGLDGLEKGIVQFIGAHGDMPLFLVEASEKLSKAHWVEAPQVSGVSKASSPLTSLGATPSSTPVVVLENQAKSQGKAKSKQQGAAAATAAEQSTFEQALQDADTFNIAGEKALVLDLQVEHETFMPTKGGSGSLGKDLKIEVFINGELADVSFVNARRSAVQIIGDKIRFSGTRVHRQTEKPWVYKTTDVFEQKANGARQQWGLTANGLVAHAQKSGTDKFGDLQPSSAYLGALAAVQLPERVKNKSSLGVVDVIITAGKGQKYGPETAYLVGPTPMDDPDFATTNPAVDPLLLPAHVPSTSFDGGAVVSPLKAMDLSESLMPMESSPDVPLRMASHGLSYSLSPSPEKNAVNLAREFGFDFTRQEAKMIIMPAVRNARGKDGAEGRSLYQRLGDLKKMNETNKAKALERLRKELDDFLTPDARDARAHDDTDEPPAKRTRRKTSSEVNFASPMMTMANTQASHFNQSLASANPHMVHINKPMASDDVFGVVDPLTQNRMNMALDSGAAPDGPLLRRIRSSSPMKTPRKTTASALAYSPTRTAIKGQHRSATSTPKRPPPPSQPMFSPFGPPSSDSNAFQAPPSSVNNTTFRAPPQTPPKNHNTGMVGMDVMNISPSKSGRGANRTSTKWDPQEQTFGQALEGFAEPESSRASCVGFARETTASRQIGKARGGYFKEEVVVVGVRFCVW